jgi:hypothetical protein
MATGLIGMLATGTAWPGPADAAAAAPLLEEGTRLMQEGRYAEACPKLEQSQQLDPNLDTLLRLGDRFEQNGQLARAWATFQSATTTGPDAGEDERTKVAQARAQKLEAMVPKLVVDVGPDARVPGLAVMRGDVDVPAASWGVPIPVDPGEHVMTATAPGRKPWSRSIVLAPANPPVTLKVPVLVPESSPTAMTPQAPVAAPPPNAPVAPPPIEPEQSARPGDSQRTWAMVPGTVGMAGLLVGVVYGLDAKNKDEDADAHCGIGGDPDACDQVGARLRDEARDAATVSTASLILGGLGLGAGVVLYLSAPSGEPAPQATAPVRVAPSLGRHHSGVVLAGRF